VTWSSGCGSPPAVPNSRPIRGTRPQNRLPCDP
jgi:hypothetical protein